MDELKTKIKNAPDCPGCYIFKDKHGWVIYVGKSKKLRNRVKQYFQESNLKDEKGMRLFREITDVEYIVTGTEVDALILEYKLIKKYKPYHNVMMKADKRYPYIKINLEGRYPAVFITADKMPGKDKYFGCFRNKDDAERTLYHLNKVWKTPICCKDVFDRPSKPCLEYHMGNCMAPCGGKADPEEYVAAVKEIIKLFEGKKVGKTGRLQKEMKAYSQQLEFEKAAVCKEQIDSLNYLEYKAQRLFNIPEDRDVIVFLSSYGGKEFSVFYIHEQEVYARADFNAGYLEEENLAAFLVEIEEVLSTGKCRLESEGRGLAECLVGIYGDKRFNVLPEKRNIQKIREVIEKQYFSYKEVRKKV